MPRHHVTVECSVDVTPRLFHQKEKLYGGRFSEGQKYNWTYTGSQHRLGECLKSITI